MLRRSKIIATLGPATDDPKILHQMIDAGLDVARLNFSHGGHAAQKKRLELLRTVAEDCGRFVGVIGDLQGPKIRVRKFKNQRVTLAKGEEFFLDSALGENDGDKQGVGVAHENMHKDVKKNVFLQ